MKAILSLVCVALLSTFPVLAQSRKPDRQTDGLKGAVKRVVTHRANVEESNGKRVETKRRLADDVQYDVSGDRLKALSYDYVGGLLRETAIYKIVDGDRVQVTDVSNAPGAIISIAPAGTPVKKYDPRYDFKFKYKTDAEGNVTEEAWWSSTGELWLRYVYEYNGDEITELVYDAHGKLNQKYVYKNDTKGNRIEMIVHDSATDKPIERVVYKNLEFDSQGNWTKRYETAGEEEDNFAQRPREMTYRTITYYPGSAKK